MNISEAEWRVMHAVWERGPSTAAEVIAAVADAGWSHRTVRTLLARLVEKGALTAAEDRHRYVYRASVSRSECVRTEARSFVEKVFAGDTGELLVHFVREARLSPEQLKELRRLLDEKE